MPPTLPNPPKKPANWGRASKTLAFWLVVVLIPVLLLQFTGAGRRDAAKITYTRFTQEVERGNVKGIVVRGGTDVTGEFNTPVNAGTGPRAAQNFTLTLPAPLSYDESKEFRGSGVTSTRRSRARRSAGS
jgi:hypothetical protein